MFKVVRNVDGVTETLKDATSHLENYFDDYATAEIQARKLNLDLILLDSDYWRVEKV
ncbi:hypothetical protein ACE1TH_06405 [Shouchella sp. JSM 1781072]|uniref:hypothetical protein n=1 Tax=Bacillaceae TaxID=186817 RepID=UPI00159BBBBC|nr:hypothetical protein [Bacillus sp. Marseille-P3800]